jgi:alpha-2-macroglobulin
MDRNRTLIAAAALVVVAAVAVYLGHDAIGWHWGNGSSTEYGTAGNGPPMGAENAVESPEFSFRRLEIDTSKASPEACLVFTRTLDTSGKTHYEDYLVVTPETRVAVRASDQRLCIGGLAFNQTYSIELKTGLPSAKGEKLDPSETVPVELRDRPPLVRFGGGILLPRENSDGVPVTTINISKLKLKVLRVGDRLLSQLETGVVDQTTLYGWSDNQIETAQGSVVWSGEMDVTLTKNEAVTTLIPLRDMLKTQVPGAYLIMAQDAAQKRTGDSEDENSGEVSAQWVIDSDIGLTTFQGGQGLSVFARSFSAARPLSSVKLTLVARNNNVLQEARTDSNGRADFDPGFFRATGGDEPVAVMAYGSGGDFTFLDLRRPVFDLTDRGVEGRDAPGPVDAFLYTERGVYRPGEKVESVTMLRDRTAHAVTAPLTLVVTRPDGIEFRRSTMDAASLMGGAAHWEIQLTPTAPQGRWQLAAYLDPKAEAVGRTGFDVADFVPQRLKVTLSPQEKFITPKQDFHVKIESRFLYGAPAANLSGEGQARITRDADPFPQYKDYVWGRDNETFSNVQITMTVPQTDDTGATIAQGNTGDLPDTSLPLKADVTLAIDEPGGRTTSSNVSLPIRTHDVWLGLRPDFDCCSVAEGATAGFQAIAVDADGKRIALNGLHYEFLREDTRYEWYQENGEWKYKSSLRTRLIAGGTFSIADNTPAKLAQTLPWGDYRLTITDPASGASTSSGFWSGWAGESEGDRPDRVAVAADKAMYKSGETAHIKFQPPSDGKALIVVAGDKVYYSKLIDAPASGAEVDVDVSDAWGAGAYVLVTQYRALSDNAGHAPVRAIGVVWLGIDNSARTLSADIGGPQVMRPRQNVTIPVTVKGLSSGEDAYLTLAAVDEGILQLTAYKTPDPAGYYFGKRRLGVGMRDEYGRLIKSEKAPIGQIRSGGDNFGGRPLAVVPTRTVALFSGLVKLVDGNANVTFAVPDFNGELRLMAVMMSKDKVGASERPLTVRDAVVGEIVLPRFLAPNDQTDAAMNLHNVEGAPGTYTAIVRTSGAVGLPNGVAETRITQNLKTGQRVLVPLSLMGRDPGIATITLALSGPQGFAVTRSWQIEVRPAQLPQAREEIALIQSDATWKSDGKLAAGLIPSTSNASLTVSAMHGYSDVAGALRWLDKYPYGCIEQTTSRAMPLLFFNDLAGLAGLPTDENLKPRIQDAIDNVLDMQNYAGGFGMWSPIGDVNHWISVFAIDFLYQADAKGYVVPQEAFRRGSRFLRDTAGSDSNDDTTRAYAFYVLARQGEVNLSDLRYFADTRGPEMKSALAEGLAAAALAHVGDKARASADFGRARDIALSANPAKYETSDYGSLLRDVAGVTALSAESAPELVPALLKRADDFNMRLNATTTQEKAWMLRAAYELSLEREPLNVLINGKPATPKAGAVRLAPSVGDLGRGLTVTNKGQGIVWRTVSVQGMPAAPLPATVSGMVMVKKSVWTMSGQPADITQLKQNDRVLVLIEGQMQNNYYHQMGVLDLLPAGLEIETTLSGDEGKVYPWLGELTSTSISQARDDRFVAAFDIGSQYRPVPEKGKPKPKEPMPYFHVAYIARAVAAGHYTMPAAVIEDMYHPDLFGRTAMGKLNVAQ